MHKMTLHIAGLCLLLIPETVEAKLHVDLGGPGQSDTNHKVISGRIHDITFPDKPVVRNTHIRFDPIADQQIELGRTLTFSIRGQDAREGEILVYSLATDAPSGSSIDPDSGQFRFTPQISGTFPVSVVVTDQDGYADAATFTVTVLPPKKP